MTSVRGAISLPSAVRRFARFPALALFVGSLLAPQRSGAERSREPAAADTPQQESPSRPPLHPLPTEELRARAPSPQWSTGIILGVCGVGQDAVWQGTDFCGALMAEALFLRRRARAIGLGPYTQLGTSGFFDFRASSGVSLHLPLGKLFALSPRLGGLLVTDHVGPAPGLEAYVELGIRGLNWSGHYSMNHGLLLGVQHAFGSTPRAGSTLWIGLRLDGFWAVAPVGALIR